MLLTPKIVIYVEGGLVQAVATDLVDIESADVLVVDADVSDEEGPSVSWPWLLSLEGLRENHPEILQAVEAETGECPA